MPDDYLNRKVNTLAPTDGIQDPQTRAFCDSLANVWQLRNGNTGFDDTQRFITKQEWDLIAKNPNIRALAGIGQPGSSTLEPGPGGGGGGGGTPPPAVPPWIQNLVDFLASGITLIDFTEVRRTSNILYANYFALTSEMRNELNNINTIISGLQNDITQINTITHDSTSASAQTLWALKETVNDPVTGLPAATAAIIEINNVTVTSTSANAKATAAMVATVNDPVTGNIANTAAIIQINTVSATSTSANAKQLAGLTAQTNDPVTGLPRATADIAAINNVSTTSSSANARKVAGMSAQVDGNLALINEINNVSANSSSASAQKLTGVIAYSGLKARTFSQPPPAPSSNSSYTLVIGDLWINTANGNQLLRWNGTAWVDAADARISSVSAGITTESNARTSSDSALAKQLNLFWAEVGSSQALVVDGTTVTANPNAGSATKFLQVQTALKDPNTGQVVAAASRQDFTTYVSLNEGRATSSYVLKVQAESGGVKAITGMTLFSEVVPGQGPKSAVVFYADTFAVYHSTTGLVPPFAVSGGLVRMNIAYISDRIQSDSWIPKTYGWIIRQDGSAEFNGAVLFGKIYSGSTLLDRDSGQVLPSVATGAWGADSITGTGIQTSANVTFYGPSLHASAPTTHRIRQGDSIGIDIPTTVIFVGIADHYISIWRRLNGQAWQRLNTTIEPTPDYGALTCAWVGTTPCAINSKWEFGVSPTNSLELPLNPAKVDIRAFSLLVTMANI
jgi:type IV secretory pathway VirB2 component (pilin)